MSSDCQTRDGAPVVGFDDGDALASLERMVPEELDELPFGVIRMDEKGRVLGYNRYESSLSTLPPERVLGRNLFLQVAPCTNNFLVAQRFLDSERLDETIAYVFTFVMRPTPVQLRLLKAPGTHQYLLVRKA